MQRRRCEGPSARPAGRCRHGAPLITTLGSMSRWAGWRSDRSRSTRLQGKPDQRDLKRKPDPRYDLGHYIMTLLRRDGVLQVCGPKDQQENGGCVPSPTLSTPETEGADQLRNSTHVDQGGREREEVRHDPSEGDGADEVHNTAHGKGCRHDPGAIGVDQNQGPSETAGLLHCRTLRQVPHVAGTACCRRSPHSRHNGGMEMDSAQPHIDEHEISVSAPAPVQIRCPRANIPRSIPLGLMHRTGSTFERSNIR